jgi:hypothetical protein
VLLLLLFQMLLLLLQVSLFLLLCPLRWYVPWETKYARKENAKSEQRKSHKPQSDEASGAFRRQRVYQTFSAMEISDAKNKGDGILRNSKVMILFLRNNSFLQIGGPPKQMLASPTQVKQQLSAAEGCLEKS